MAKAKENSTTNVKTQAVLTNPAKNASGATAPGTQPAPTVQRRGSTMKEVIPFEWKLIGEAAGAVLTLFKSVEREDVDAQFERIGREGYYANLRIVDIDFKIKQTTAVKTELKKVKLAQEARVAKLAKRMKTAQAPKAKMKKPKAKKAAPKRVASKNAAKSKKVTKKKVAKSAPARKKKSARTVKSKSTRSKKATKKKTVTKSAAKKKKKKTARKK